MLRAVSAFFLLATVTLAPPERPPAPLFALAPGSPLAVGRQPADVAVGDVNGDGHLDILTANVGSNDISLLLGDGRGGFRAALAIAFPGSTPPHRILIRDVNNDKRPDLVVSSHDSNDVVVLLGDGNGGFASAPGSPFAALRATPPHNHGLEVADLNGDGKVDIVTGNQNDNSVSVLLGDGGAFRPAPGSPFAVGRSPYPLALGDVNRDRHIDIVAPNVGSNSVTVLLGDGRGGFLAAAGSPIAVATRPYGVALGDLNADGRLDAVISHDDITLITILLGDGRGGFRPAPGSPHDVGQRAGRLVLADLNRDGRLDLASGTAADTVVVLLGNARGRFAPAPGSPLAAGPGPWAVAVADVNGDGKLDILTANFQADSVTIMLGR